MKKIKTLKHFIKEELGNKEDALKFFGLKSYEKQGFKTEEKEEIKQQHIDYNEIEWNEIYDQLYYTTRGAIQYTNLGSSVKEDEILLDDLIDYIERSPKTSGRQKTLNHLYEI